jgi:hypothetical protein
MVSTKRWAGTLVTILVLSTLLLNGCGKKAEEKMMEKVLKGTTGKETKVDIRGNNIRIEDKDSKTEMSSTTTWPPEMFADVPQFTAGTIRHVIKGQEGRVQKFNIFFVGIKEDSVKQYADVLKEKGWQSDLMQMGNKGGMLNAQKGNIVINFPFSAEKKEGTLVAYSTP